MKEAEREGSEGALGVQRGDAVEEEGVGGTGWSKEEDGDDPHIVKKLNLVQLKDPTSYFLCQILPLATIISLYKEKRAHFLFTPLLLPEYCF